MPVALSIIGFDSAWVDKSTTPGAVCAIRVYPNGRSDFIEPELASFAQALSFIAREQTVSEKCLVALDQPTIVPNVIGCRPVDRIAGSLISWMGGGVQPANRSKLGMFDDAAPIWRFKDALGAVEDPERSRSASSGLFLIEVFPALALPTLEAAFFGRLKGARYNPDRRKTFKLDAWQGVQGAVRNFATEENLSSIVNWSDKSATAERPRKHSQDKLDSVLCALIGYIWIMRPRSDSIMIGDLVSGHMISPASPQVRLKLEAAAAERGVPVN